MIIRMRPHHQSGMRWKGFFGRPSASMLRVCEYFCMLSAMGMSAFAQSAMISPSMFCCEISKSSSLSWLMHANVKLVDVV